MKRYFVIAFLSLAALALLAAVGLGIVLATVNPNDYKDDISALVEGATGRQLIFQGSLETTVFPSLGLRTGRLVLNDSPVFGAEPFASVENASCSMALLPLLRGRIVINDIRLDGLTLKLATTSSGRHNWDFSPSGTSGSEGRPGGSATEGVVALKDETPKPAPAEKGHEKPLDLAVDSLRCVKAAVTYRDMEAGESYRFAVETLHMENVRLGADMSVALAGSAEDEGSGNKAQLAVKALIRLNTDGGVAGRIEEFLLSAAAKEAALKLSAQAALQYLPATRTLEVRDVKGALDATDFSGGLAVTLPGGKGAQAGSKGLDVRGTLDIGELNLDKILADVKAMHLGEQAGHPVSGSLGVAKPAGGGAKPAPVKDQSERKALSPVLRALDADVTLTAKGVTVAKMPIKDVQAKFTAVNGKVVMPYSLKLFGGDSRGTLKADLAATPPQISLDNAVSGLPVGEVVHTLTGKRSFSGAMTSSLDLRGQGLGWNDLAPTLMGKASADVANGQVEGFSLIPQGLPGVHAVPVNFPVERVSASLNIVNGIGTSRDFLMLSPVMKGSGGGVVNLVREDLAFSVEFMLGGLPPAVPVDISGPLAAPSYRVEMKKLLKNTASGVLSTPEAAGKALEGLFGKGGQ